MPFLDSLDIANRALQHCGVEPIADVTEDSKRNTEVSNAYDKVRRAELRRNVWRFSIKHTVIRAIDTTTMLLVPGTYDATKTYYPGAIVADSNGIVWTSTVAENVNNTPGDTGVWDQYFGPISISLYDSTTTYFAGELVYVLSAVAGGYTIYQSLVSDNSADPATAVAWDATVTYDQDQVVSYSSALWRSLIPLNKNVTPADGPVAFDVTATYAASDTVTASDNFIYSSVSGSNIGHEPTTDGGVHWTNTGVANGWSRSPTVPTSATTWRVVTGATLKSFNLIYPIGSGPASQSSTRNVFRLPAGFLRVAPQDPKAGSNSYLGSPGGLQYSDWDFEGDFIVSSETGAILLRFAADITDVQEMDDMFCEGFACRIAEAVCEAVTQSTAKLQSIAAEYGKFMGEARTVNSVETGAVEPPLDDWIACRA